MRHRDISGSASLVALNLVAGILVIVQVSDTPPTSLSGIRKDSQRQTLEAALLLAGDEIARLPITLTSVRPDVASHNVEAWTDYRADGHGERIFVYSESEMFRCASWPLSMYQCLVRVASVLVHEAWHFQHGRNEAAAYDAQIAFLMRNRATVEHIGAVRLARKHVLAAQHAATEAATQRYYGSQPDDALGK